MPPGARRLEDDLPEPDPHPEDDQPDPDSGEGGVTGRENLARQQKDPDLEDTAGGHP